MPLVVIRYNVHVESITVDRQGSGVNLTQDRFVGLKEKNGAETLLSLLKNRVIQLTRHPSPRKP